MCLEVAYYLEHVSEIHYMLIFKFIRMKKNASHTLKFSNPMRKRPRRLLDSAMLTISKVKFKTRVTS